MIPAPALTAVAHAPVVCAAPNEWAAWVATWSTSAVEAAWDRSTGRIVLQAATCRILIHPRHPALVLRAAQTLGHEAAHAAGEYDEAAADCFGWRAAGSIAQQLGASANVVRAVADGAYLHTADEC